MTTIIVSTWLTFTLRLEVLERRDNYFNYTPVSYRLPTREHFVLMRDRGIALDFTLYEPYYVKGGLR